MRLGHWDRCRRATLCAVVVAFTASTGAAWGADRPPVTPAGFRVSPAGVEFGVSRVETGFQGPLGGALSPDGQWLLAASSGASTFHSADLFDVDAGVRTGAVYYPAGAAPGAASGQAVFYGVAWAPDGRRAWVAGGG